MADALGLQRRLAMRPIVKREIPPKSRGRGPLDERALTLALVQSADCLAFVAGRYEASRSRSFASGDATIEIVFHNRAMSPGAVSFELVNVAQ